MTKYRDQLHTLESHITTLRFVIGFLCLVIIGLWSGWNSASETLRVHIPPDLRSGANLAHDAVHPANVYAFAGYILQHSITGNTTAAKSIRNAFMHWLRILPTPQPQS